MYSYRCNQAHYEQWQAYLAAQAAAEQEMQEEEQDVGEAITCDICDIDCFAESYFIVESVRPVPLASSSS